MEHHKTIIKNGIELCVACKWLPTMSGVKLCEPCLEARKEDRDYLTQQILRYEEIYDTHFVRVDDVVYKQEGDFPNANPFNPVVDDWLHPDEVHSFDVDVSEMHQPDEVEVRVQNIIRSMRLNEENDLETPANGMNNPNGDIE